MQNTRFPVNQIRVQGKRIAAEHEMALGPVLRNSDVPRSNRFLSAHIRHESEKHYTPHRNSNIKMRWLHSYLRWQWIGPIVAAFRFMGIVDIRQFHRFLCRIMRSDAPRR